MTKARGSFFTRRTLLLGVGLTVVAGGAAYGARRAQAAWPNWVPTINLTDAGAQTFAEIRLRFRDQIDAGLVTNLVSAKTGPDRIELLWRAGAGALDSRLARGPDGAIQIAPRAPGAPAIPLIGHAKPVTSAAITRDGAWIVTGSEDDTARVWDAKTGAPRHRLNGHPGDVGHVAFSPDAAWVATACDDAKARLWRMADAALLATIHGHNAELRQAAFSENGRCLVTSAADGRVRVWDLIPHPPPPKG